METLQKMSSRIVEPIFYFVWNKYMLVYVLFNIVTFLIVKYWGIRD